jgi:hypothetical protein
LICLRVLHHAACSWSMLIAMCFVKALTPDTGKEFLGGFWIDDTIAAG